LFRREYENFFPLISPIIFQIYAIPNGFLMFLLLGCIFLQGFQNNPNPEQLRNLETAYLIF